MCTLRCLPGPSDLIWGGGCFLSSTQDQYFHPQPSCKYWCHLLEKKKKKNATEVVFRNIYRLMYVNHQKMLTFLKKSPSEQHEGWGVCVGGRTESLLTGYCRGLYTHFWRIQVILGIYL